MRILRSGSTSTLFDFGRSNASAWMRIRKARRSHGLEWYQPGKTAEETQRDLVLCQHEAALQRQNVDYSGAQGTGALLDAWAQGKKEDDIIRRGMTAMGYSLVDKAKVEQRAR